MFLGLVVALAGRAPGQNFPPVVQLSTSTEVAVTQESIQFSSAGTFDPDGGPQPLSLSWDFTDGRILTNTNPTVSFTNAGAYIVSLTVSDGAATIVQTKTIFIRAPVTPQAPSRSSPIALRPGMDELWLVNPDADSLTVIDLSQGNGVKVAELPTGAEPRNLAFGPAGQKVYVTCRKVNELWVYDVSLRSLQQRLQVGHLPHGVVVDGVNSLILVSNEGDASVSLIRPDLVVERVIAVPAFPRAMALSHDGTQAYVSHFISTGMQGGVTGIELPSGVTNAVISLVDDPGPDTTSSGRGIPNLLGALTLEPSGEHLWFGGLKSNSNRGLFLSGELLVPKNTVRGVFGKIRRNTQSEVLTRRIDTNDADSVSAIAFSPDGRHLYAVHQGAETLSVYDTLRATLFTPGDGGSVPFENRIDVGLAPQGLVVNDSGTRLYVVNFLSRDVSIIGLDTPSDPVFIGTIQTHAEPLSANIVNGKRLFYRSRGPVHSDGNYIACASCHADGGFIDGRTWDFTDRGEGLRNTINLFGQGGVDNGPVHWSANFDEIQDFENDIVNAFGGTGLAQDGAGPNAPLGAPNAGRSQDLDDLAAYVSSLKNAAPSPYRLRDGSLSVAALRGKNLFLSPTTGCESCHRLPRFTDSQLTPDPLDFVLHDVSTLKVSSGQRLGGILPGLDTPSLTGLWRSAPYLHDGSVPTLFDVLVTYNTSNQHGTSSSLTTNQIDDLIAYLNALDSTTNDVPRDVDLDGISDTWELHYGLNPTDQTDALLDGDGDGMSHLEEFMAGTLPDEAASLFAIRRLVAGQDNHSLFIPSTLRTSYQVEYSDTLDAIDWMPLYAFEGDGSEIRVNDPDLNVRTRIYRARTQP